MQINSFCQMLVKACNRKNLTQSVTYTPPGTTGNCIVTVTLTDGCGRQAFASEGALVTTVLAASTNLRGSNNATNRTMQLPKFTLLSNPVKGNIVFEYDSPRAGNIDVTLIDMSDRVIKHQSGSLQKGTNKIQMDNCHAWPSGMYLLRVVAAGNSMIQKVQLIK
jgi:hypothetical protein